MKRIINFFRGWVEFTVTGVFPERLYNLCAQYGVAFWGLVRIDAHTVTMRIAASDRKAFRQVAAKAQCEILEERRGGAPFFALRFRKRYAFLGGLLCALAAVVVLSNFVLTVEVTGNETVPTAVITAQLRRLGVRPGRYGPALDVRQIAQEALLELDELSYMTINLHGTKAEVIVRERVAPPEVRDKDELCDIVAGADGVILRIEALAGDGLVQPGDAVLKGETLIAGMVRLEAQEYSGLPPTFFSVRAEGKVYARTRRTLTARIPLEVQVKRYTGESETRRALLLPGQRVNFYQNSGISYSEYDKITESKSLSALPVTFLKETVRAYVTETAALDAEAAQPMLEEQLHTRLAVLIGDGTVEREQFSAKVDGGFLTVTLTAECEEQIGREGPLKDRTGEVETKDKEA
ncbi:MAG: sporulation protein YqfD [Oscillospiraceae bacterium]|nr:sporulation protein YqfD [Oscillospiraceae bacterium]